MEENTTGKFEEGIEDISKENNKDNSKNNHNTENKSESSINETSSKNRKRNRNKRNKHNFRKRPFTELNNNKLKDNEPTFNNNNPKFTDKDIIEKKDSKPIKTFTHPPGSLGAMSETARKNLSEALNKKAESVLSISKDEDGWNAEVEVVDEEYLPDIELKSMNDIIGVYVVKLDNKGELISWNKRLSRKRGEIK